MKLAVLLFGISLNDNYRNWLRRRKREGIRQFNVDYRKSLDNYKEYIFDYFKKKGYEIDIFFSTNIFANNDDCNELIQTFNPVGFSFVRGSVDRVNARHTKIKSVIELCLNSKNEYDHILITRFDLLFKKDFDSVNIDMDKFNTVTILEKPSCICDNFYILPYKFLEKFNDIVKKVKNGHLYKNLLDREIGKDNINYIDPFDKSTPKPQRHIENITFYKIVREIVK